MFKRILKDFLNEFEVYRIALTDPRTPRRAKVMLGLAFAYALSPVDLIPDFIPVLGQIDDAVIFGFLVSRAVKLIPGEVLDDARARVLGTPRKPSTNGVDHHLSA